MAGGSSVFYVPAESAAADDQAADIALLQRVGRRDVAARAAKVAGAEPFVRQLCWRDFFGQLLASDPALTWRDLRPPPEMQAPLLDPDEALERWRTGTTGLPLVDAGMRQLAREGMTMLCVTHEMGFARDIAGRVCFLEAGRILEQGPPQQIFSAPREERTRRFLQRVIAAGRL